MTDLQQFVSSVILLVKIVMEGQILIAQVVKVQTIGYIVPQQANAYVKLGSMILQIFVTLVIILV